MSPYTVNVSAFLLSIFMFSACPPLPAAAAPASELLPVLATRITLYNRQGYVNSPSNLPPKVLRPDPRVGCYNLGPQFAGQLGSGVIEWNVKDAEATASGNSSAPHVICNVVFFFHGPDCTGGAIGRMIPGGAAKASPTVYTYANTVFK